MEIYAPIYAINFKCIADKCRHSCCIDWEIDIDEKTYEKYKSLKTDFADEILSNVETDDGVPHFSLDEKGRCKNLDERGLCRIISNIGEEYLCDICRLHPRFFNRVGNRIEMGLGLCCEEAVRLTLTDTRHFELVKIGENNDEEYVPNESNFDAISARDGVISFIESEKCSFFEKLSRIEKRYEIKTDFKTNTEWLEYLFSLEILDIEWQKILKSAENTEQKYDYTKFNSIFEGFFKYLVYRHVSIAESENSFSGRLAFATLGVKVVGYLAAREENLTEARLFDIIRLYSSEIEYSEQNTADIIFELETEQI